MSTNEEILNSRIIGFIEPVTNTENARLTVVGYKKSNGDYVALDKMKATSVFFPEGKVYAPKFQFNREKGYNVSPNSFVEFSVRTSLKDASFKGDEYIMDCRNNVIPKTFTSILTVKYQTSLESGFITQDELSSCIDKSELKKYSGSFFLRSGNYLYGLFKYESATDSIRPIMGKETKVFEIDDTIYSECCVRINQKEYFIGNLNSLPFNQVGIIDCMDDRQLGEWFKDQLKSCAATETFLSIKKEMFQEFSTKFKETNDSIDEIRLERVKGKLYSLEWTYDEIQNLLVPDSTLMENLKISLQNMKDEYHSQWMKDIQNEKNKLENEIKDLESKKENLLNEISNAKEKNRKKLEEIESAFEKRKEKLEEKISEKEKTYQVLEKNYTEIIEIIKLQTAFKSNSVSDVLEIEPIVFEKSGTPFTKLEEEEGYGFFNLLKKKLELDEIPEIVKAQLNKSSPLFTNKACFVPSVSWAYLYAKAIRNSKIYNIHVEHDWLHYKDFFNKGLASVLNSCYKNEDVNHILILDSLNLTQPECGLQPLLDVISGYSFLIPGINKPYPKNLKIFATIQSYSEENRIGIPLNSDNFSSWGRIATVEDKLLIENNILECDERIGYFEPKDLNINKINDNSAQVENGYFN